jgi:phenylalanyl-tRNA synthetase beta chain
MAGAVLPPGADGKPFEIKVGQLRGVESQGMLCSAKELKLSEEGSGLLELPDDAPVGQNFRDYYALNDLKFTIKLTPNKADCLSVLGVAREVSALTGVPLTAPTFRRCRQQRRKAAGENLGAGPVRPFLGPRDPQLKAATPDWMKQRLERSGQRSVSALVDISNYVMLELGRPTHVFDLAKIHGGLDVRWGRKGESLKLLNGNTIEIDEWVGVIADDKEIESLAGIMGGDDRRVAGHRIDLPGSRILVAERDPGPRPQVQLLDRCGAPLRARRGLCHHRRTHRAHHLAADRNLRHPDHASGPGGRPDRQRAEASRSRCVPRARKK